MLQTSEANTAVVMMLLLKTFYRSLFTVTHKIRNGGEKTKIRSYKKHNHIWFHIICCFPKVPNFSNSPKDLPFHSLCRNTSVLSRPRETTLKPNMCSSPFITLGCLAAACVPPLLQSILFNSLGRCLVNKICTFLQVFCSTFEQD